MALDGSFKTNDYNGRYLLFTWVATQNISNNSSTITWVLRGAGQTPNNIYYTSGNFKVVIDGETVYSSAARINLSQTTVVARGTKTIHHSADGTGSFSASAEAGIYTVAVNCKGSGTFTLDKIPRGATLLTAPNFNDEQNPTITYSNPIGNAATALQAVIGDGSIIKIAKDISKTGTSYTFNFTEAERAILREMVEYGSTTTLTMRIITTIGSDKLYSTRNVQFTIKDGTPLINPTAVDSGQISITLTGDVNTMIKGYNVIKCAVNPTARKGATIVSSSITCGSKTVNSSNATFSYVENNEFTFTATDSRRNTVTQVITLPMYDYGKPTCNIQTELSLNESDNTKVNISFVVSGEYYRGTLGLVRNALMLNWKLYDGTNTVISDGSIGLDNSGNENAYEAYNVEYDIEELLDYKGSYVVEVQAIDTTTFEAVATSKVLKAVPVFDWGENDFNFNVPVTIEGALLLDYVVEQGTTSMGSNGTWYWSKWKSGKAECYGCRNYGNVGVSSAWGNTFISTTFTQDLPYGLFKETPQVMDIRIVKTDNGAGWIITENATGASATSTGKFAICRATSYNIQQAYIGFNIIGRWK